MARAVVWRAVLCRLQGGLIVLPVVEGRSCHGLCRGSRRGRGGGAAVCVNVLKA